MKNKIFILIFLGFISNFQAQVQDSRILERNINKTYLKKPDSAKYFLKQYLKHKSEMADTTLSQQYGKLAVTFNQMGKVDSSFYYFDKCIDAAPVASVTEGDAYFNKAIALRRAADYEKALAALDSANTIFKANNYKKGIGLVYLQRGSVQNNLLNSKLAIELLNKSIAIFTEIGNKREKYAAKQILANTYFNEGDYTFAIELYEDLLPQLKKTQPHNYYLTLLNYGESHLNLGDLEEARKIYGKALEGLKRMSIMSYYFYGLSKIALINKKEGNLEKSKLIYEKSYAGLKKHKSKRQLSVAAEFIEVLNNLGLHGKALQVIETIQKNNDIQNNKLSIRDEISFIQNTVNIYEENALFKKALKASKRLTKLNDSLQTIEEDKVVLEMQAKYQNKFRKKNNSILRKKNELLKSEAKNKNIILILISFIVLALLLAGMLFYRKSKQKSRLRMEAVYNLKDSKEALAKKIETERALHQERKENLAVRERELVASSLEMANLKNEISVLLQNVKNGESLQRVKFDLKNILKEKDEWVYFMKKFVEVHPNFIKTIRTEYPQLTESDLNFCALLKLRLSNKEIAQILNISHRSVISKRYRLRKKISISAEEISLEDWLNEKA